MSTASKPGPADLLSPMAQGVDRPRTQVGSQSSPRQEDGEIGFVRGPASILDSVVKKRQRRNSKIMAEVVSTVSLELESALRSSDVYGHHGTAGASRENSLHHAIGRLLSERYAVGRGLAFDSLDQKSKQLDLVIARRSHVTSALGGANFDNLYPCESVLAVTEVKKVLRAAEVDAALLNAQSIRALRPFGNQAFVEARTDGEAASSTEHRVMYSLFASDSDLSFGTDWAARELARLESRANALGVEPTVIDRLFILSRGIINVRDRVAKTVDVGAEVVFGWFYQLANHADRENGRRPDLDMDHYRQSFGWKRV